MSPRSDVMLEVRSVVATYPRSSARALDEVSMVAAPGEIVSILGASGSGKSTLLRVVAGLLELDSGSVTIDGVDVTGHAPQKRSVGMMFQDHALFPHLDVGDNVAYGLRMHGVARERRADRVRELLDLVHLGGYERRAVESLSGGQRQRVALARALAIDPKVLLLDEPMSSLDRTLREELVRDLRGIFRAKGLTVVHVTHDHAEAFALADSVVLLREGNVEQAGTPSAVWSTPRTVHAARPMGHRNVGRRVAFGLPRLDVEADSHGAAGGSMVLVRDDAVRVTAISEGAHADGVLLSATFAGTRVALVVELVDGGAQVHASCTHDDAAALAVGDAVHVEIDPNGVVELVDSSLSSPASGTASGTASQRAD